jgi:hypothetical protein
MADAANVESKLEIAKQRKSEADAAFKDGQLQAGAPVDLFVPRGLAMMTTDRIT